MPKPGDKEWLPEEEFLRRTPKKRISGGAIFLDDQDRILIVQSLYRDFWLIPGGGVEAFESPQRACVREVREETGLTIEKPSLIGVLHVANQQKKDDVLYFYFFGGRISAQETSQIQLQASELSQWKLVSAAEAASFTHPGFAQQLPQYIQASKNGQVAYFEEMEDKK